MFDHIKNNEITEAQIFLTRRCNTKCGACNLSESGRGLKELDLFEWIIAFQNLNNLGIKTVKIMGGEPTEVGMDKLLRIIRYAKDYTDIKVALLSNSKWDKKLWFDKLCDSGLYGYYASVDVSSGASYSEGSLEKSQLGYQTLLHLKENGRIPLLAANVVISKNNLTRVPELVNELSKKGFYINLCTFQCGDRPTYKNVQIEYNYRKEPRINSPVLTTVDTDMYGITHDLIRMKKDGIKIAVPKSYLENMLTYGLYGGTWQCDIFSQLRIDCDGVMMICNEFRGKQQIPPNIVTPDVKREDDGWVSSFITYWYQERAKYKCHCYWSCFLQAVENIKNKTLEFEFAE